ncbi:TPA: hypothetical protein RQN04_002023 [Aeromonas hydrophila]|nr:hypothetical protein [Aeromonas hydrophila]
MDIRQVPGASAGKPLDVAPESAPLSTAHMTALAAQKQREAQELAQLVARRQQEEQEERDRLARVAEERRQKAQVAQEEQEREHQKWMEVNARQMVNGSLYQGVAEGFARVVLCAEPVVPMLVDGDLVVKPLGITLEVFELVSPIVTAGSADVLMALYRDEAQRRWDALVEKARQLLGDGDWLYTSALPAVYLENAGPVSRHDNKPSNSHQIVSCQWGDVYIHQPHVG